MEQLLDQVNQTTDVVPFVPAAQRAAEEQRVKHVEQQEEYGGLIKCYDLPVVLLNRQAKEQV